MIATFDTETEGVFGDIRLIGWYDGHDYRVSTDANDWWEFASKDSIAYFGNTHLVWYAHNLDFDHGKLWGALPHLRTEISKLSSEALAKAGGYKNVDDYYSHVPVDDPDYLEYLRHDVMGLYEVLSRLHRFTGLSEADFCAKLTTASLAMKLYQTWFDVEYKALSKTKWCEEPDTSMRRAFYGGRTEVYGTHVENGFHYDVNSLYPFVMG